MALRIKPSKSVFVCLIAVGGVLLATCVFTYINRASRLHVLQVKVQQKQTQLDGSEKIVRRLAEAEQTYLDAQDKLSILEQGVSTKAYVPTLLRQLEELAKGKKLRVVGIRPKVAVKQPEPAQQKDGEKTVKQEKPPYDTLDIDIELTGKYWDITRFLYDITSFPKIVKVRDVQLSPLTTDVVQGASPQLSARISTTAFILRQSAEVAVTKLDAPIRKT